MFIGLGSLISWSVFSGDFYGQGAFNQLVHSSLLAQSRISSGVVDTSQEEDPQSFADTLEPTSALSGQDQVFWYVSTGKQILTSFRARWLCDRCPHDG
jgi:hypothetical protein